MSDEREISDEEAVTALEEARKVFEEALSKFGGSMIEAVIVFGVVQSEIRSVLKVLNGAHCDVCARTMLHHAHAKMDDDVRSSQGSDEKKAN